MGKSAERRRKWRQEFLKRLSLENHKRFELEWGKRLESWCSEIQKKGREGQIAESPVFGTLDYAKEILEECGPDAVRLKYKVTEDLLNNECCRALSHQISKKIYRINQKWEPPVYLGRSLKGNVNEKKIN